MPCPQDEFRFLLQGQGFSRTYRLCARNDFCVYFDDLMEGSYEISEVDENWNVRYRVNGKAASVPALHWDVMMNISTSSTVNSGRAL
ncbi:MAG: hypothetical protein ACLRRB_01690 [Ruminococcus sp.]